MKPVTEHIEGHRRVWRRERSTLHDDVERGITPGAAAMVFVIDETKNETPTIESSQWKWIDRAQEIPQGRMVVTPWLDIYNVNLKDLIAPDIQERFRHYRLRIDLEP